MDAVGFEFVVLAILLILVLILNLYDREILKNKAIDYDDAINEIHESINIVAQVLNRLPEMVPQFQINQNPLIEILNAWKGMVSEQSPHEAHDSLGALPLRDESGRFSDGEEGKE